MDKHDEGFILIDNEDGIYSDRRVAERLIEEYLDHPLWALPYDERVTYAKALDTIDTQTDEEDREQEYIELQNDMLDAMSSRCPAGYAVGLVEDRCGVIAYYKLDDENSYTVACQVCYDMGFMLKNVDLDGQISEVVACTCESRLYSDLAAFARWKALTQDFLYCRIVARINNGRTTTTLASSYFNPHQIIPLLQEMPYTARRAVMLDIPNMYDCFAIVY